jgi:hypothetical protein
MREMTQTLLVLLVLVGCAATQRPTAEDLEKACPEAARVMTVECPLLALEMCGDAGSLDECGAREALEAECDRRIQAEVDKCP